MPFINKIVKSFIVQALGDLKGTQKNVPLLFLNTSAPPYLSKNLLVDVKTAETDQVSDEKKVQNCFYFWQFLIREIKMFLEIL
jgi:hypothetical protein